MPIYEYECEKCGHQFEQIQKFSDDPIDTCPKCGDKVKRVIQPVAHTMKKKEMLHRGVPVHQTEDGHWQEEGLMERAMEKKPRYAR